MCPAHHRRRPPVMWTRGQPPNLRSHLHPHAGHGRRGAGMGVGGRQASSCWPRPDCVAPLQDQVEQRGIGRSVGFSSSAFLVRLPSRPGGVSTTTAHSDNTLHDALFCTPTLGQTGRPAARPQLLTPARTRTCRCHAAHRNHTLLIPNFYISIAT